MRAPQQDRSRLTRHRLLEATVDCLAEFGWSATTVAVVAQRAGVSRGAAQHHFPTREDLITAALEFMFDSRMEQARREVTELPTGEGRTEAVVARLVDYYTGTLFKAALQVWTAAAADPECGIACCRSRSASGASRIARPSRASVSTTRTPRYADSSRPPSTSPADSAWPMCSPTTPAARAPTS